MPGRASAVSPKADAWHLRLAELPSPAMAAAVALCSVAGAGWALALRRRLDLQRSEALPAFADKTLLVVGRARYTPDGCPWGGRFHQH